MGIEKRTPFIHTFSVGEKYYVFDVNTDKILNISKSLYQYLEKKLPEEELENLEDAEIKEVIAEMRKMGFLKTKRVKCTEHPYTPYVNSFLESRVTSLVLQVTQNCNLRCEYCVYSGSYHNRVHSNKRMSFEMAKRGIDFLIKHSKDCNAIHIGFYGGEPLLEFDLIHKCMQYASEKGYGKKIYFNLTTNGTLLTKEMVEIFEKYDLHLMFSLDGPKEIHDMSRKFASNEGSFETLINNVKMIKEYYPVFFENNIAFNTVLNPENGYSCVSDFIAADTLLNTSPFMSGIVSPINAKNEKTVSEQFVEEERYEYFLLLLEKVNEIKEGRIPPLEAADSVQLEEMRFQKNLVGNFELPDKSHHAGPCIPGSFRLFMNVDGDFYPCERVCENSEFVKMGNINEGLDVEKAKKILNIEEFTKERCHECWAYNYCHMCVADIEWADGNPEKSILKRCKEIKERVEDKFKDYCVLKDYGFQY